MGDKPSYLGLLNAIAVGERGGEALFEAWAAATPSDEVRCVLRTVALREGEHARAFEKRLDELGYGVIPKDDPELPARVALAACTATSDCEKFKRLGYSKELPAGPDFFARFFEDTSMDIPTTTLMGRYVAEERDTLRRLRACYAQVRAAFDASCAASGMGADATAGASAAADAALDERLCRIETAIADLAAKTEKALRLQRGK